MLQSSANDIFQTELRWDWSKIDLSDDMFWSKIDTVLPKNFEFGTASSAFQIEGSSIGADGSGQERYIENNWTRFMPDEFRNNRGTDHWNRATEDAKLIAEIGMNSYRFSVDWSKIEPEKGLYDQRVIDHYVHFAKELRRYGVRPIVCFFHFALPLWFEDIGGFAKKQNKTCFVQFCEKMAEQFDGIVSDWLTYNEPIAYAIETYMLKNFPPGFSKNIFLYPSGFAAAGNAYKNMLNAHVEIYEKIKKQNGKNSIGFAMFFHPLDPYSDNTVERFICKNGNYLLHDITVSFFKNGTFDWFKCVTDQNEKAPKSLDFIGVNYYRHEVYKFNWYLLSLKSVARENEERAIDNGKIIYPEGLYRSIAKASEFGVSIYVTENGIADNTDTQKNMFIKKHLYAVGRALQDSYDVRSYSYWTIFDSLGWKRNYVSRYGLYRVNWQTYERTLCDNVKPFINFVKKRNLFRG